MVNEISDKIGISRMARKLLGEAGEETRTG